CLVLCSWWFHEAFDLSWCPAGFFGFTYRAAFFFRVVFQPFFEVDALGDSRCKVLDGLHAFFVNFACFIEDCLFCCAEVLVRCFHALTLRCSMTILKTYCWGSSLFHA